MDFYSGLFTKEAVDLNAQQLLLSNVSAKLPMARAQDCEGPLSVAECFAALQGMARCKAPGLDGLPMEFYLRFWDILGEDLVEVLNFCYGAGVLSKTQRRGLITLTLIRGIVWTPVTGALLPC